MPRLEKLLLLQGMAELLALIASCVLVAVEACYHSQSYRDYTRTDKACKYSDLDDEPDSDETNYCNIQSQVPTNCMNLSA